MLRPFARPDAYCGVLLGVVAHKLETGQTFKPRANGRNIAGQQLPTLLDVTCCVRLHTLLNVLVQSLKLVKLFIQQLPTFLLFCDRRSVAQLFQHCWGHARSLRMDHKDL